MMNGRWIRRMPVHKVRGGWRYGKAGHGHKIYASKVKAMKQARAIAISMHSRGVVKRYR